MGQPEWRHIETGITHWPRHLAAWMKGVSQAKFQRGAIKHLRLIGERHSFYRSRELGVRVIIFFEIPC